MSSADPFNLQRFLQAQERVYLQVLEELKRGHKRSHWMWYIFPQFDGLAFSSTSAFYAIKSLEEARQYLNHPILGPRLLECANLLLAHTDQSASGIFGYPDDLKLRSSMTLFASVTEPGSVFKKVLAQFFDGQPDTKTLALIR